MTGPTVSATTPGCSGRRLARRFWLQVHGRISDNGSGVNLSSARFTLTDEYGTVQPTGQIVVASDGSFTVNVPLVAARHDADADGRKYTIVVSAKDNAGNEGTASVVVRVPHDQGK